MRIRSFQDVPFRVKLMTAISLAVFVALLVASAAFFFNDVISFKQSKVRDLRTLSQILGSNCVAALSFDDVKAAEETLRSLVFRPHVVTAAIYKNDGTFFVGYQRDQEILKASFVPGPAGVRFERHRITIVSPILLNDQRVGTIDLESDLKEIDERFYHYAGIAFFILLFSFGVALVFSYMFQRVMARPVEALSEAATAVWEKKDYSIRVQGFGQDELGQLTDNFNRMLDEIQSRDRSLIERKKAEELLAQQSIELARSNRDLEGFAYAVSHDLKAPLRGIHSLATWIAEDYQDKLDEEGKDQLKALVSRTKRMHLLIDGILEYSRIGRVREDVLDLDLNRLIEEILDSLQPSPSIRIEVQRPLPVLRAEKVRIQQLFQNLFSNAIKYIDKPQGRIRVNCLEDGSFWRFSVSDNGPGIEERHYERIFGLFQTLESKERTDSTGIGLSLVKRIVEFYGGKVWVESIVGQGSTFYFTFPKTGISLGAKPE